MRAAIDTLRDGLGGPFTVLVNNAARDDRHAIDDVTPEYWDDRMATNLRHQFFCVQALKADMIAAGGGSIINMSSNSFLLASGGMPAYTAAKSAVIGLTRGLARDLGPHHIRANIVYPGWIITQRQLDLWMTDEAEAKRAAGQCIPDRLYEPDVARMVLWLAADDIRMGTAREFVVDCGWFCSGCAVRLTAAARRHSRAGRLPPCRSSRPSCIPGSSTVTCIAVATATTAASATSSADRYDRCAASIANWISA